MRKADLAKLDDVLDKVAIATRRIIEEGPGPAMLVLRSPAGDEVLIPFVRAYLRKIDLEGKRLEMDLPEGLLAVQTPSQDKAE